MAFFGKAPLAPPSAIRLGANIVRRIFAEADCSKGLSTAEIYELALQHPIPEGYQGDKRFDPDNPNFGPHRPPHNEHPIRSKAFLKDHILKMLLNAKELEKVVSTREITTPIFAKKKGKTLKNPTKPTASASSENPITIKAWVWKPREPPPPKALEPVREPFGAAVGVGEDFSHLNKRRQGAREEKIERAVKTMRQLQAQKEQQEAS